MPMAVWSVVFAGKCRLRHSVEPLVAAASAVATMVTAARAATRAGASIAASAVASKLPEAMPMSAKFSGVIGVAQARMAFTAA